jgi:hypothetical protein
MDRVHVELSNLKLFEIKHFNTSKTGWSLWPPLMLCLAGLRSVR